MDVSLTVFKILTQLARKSRVFPPHPCWTPPAVERFGLVSWSGSVSHTPWSRSRSWSHGLINIVGHCISKMMYLNYYFHCDSLMDTKKGSESLYAVT